MSNEQLFTHILKIVKRLTRSGWAAHFNYRCLVASNGDPRAFIRFYLDGSPKIFGASWEERHAISTHLRRVRSAVAKMTAVPV